MDVYCHRGSIARKLSARSLDLSRAAFNWSPGNVSSVLIHTGGAARFIVETWE